MESTAQQIPKASSGHTAQAQVPQAPSIADVDASPSAPDPGAEKPESVTESGAQQDPNLSQKLWNDAYDSLEEDEDKLVEAYVKALTKFLEVEEATDTSAAGASDISTNKDVKAKETTDISGAGTVDISTKLKNRAKRQMYMKKLVQEGRVKVAKTSKITEGVGVVAEAILSAKPVIDLAIQSIPQAAPAALPWAGVCIGLQVSNRPLLA
jgi:hypothetical protein